MTYYEDYRLKVVETDGKYTIYDSKYGGRAVRENICKEAADEKIQAVLSKRKSKMTMVPKTKMGHL